MGTRYGIVTPYTSYLATDGSAQIDEFSTDASRTSAPTRLPLNARNVSPTLMSPSGQRAVTESKKARAKQDALSVVSEDDEIIQTGQVRKIGAKTFYLENEVWIDSEFKAEAKLPEIKLKFAENDYFDVITKEKELAQFFSLGEQVLVVWKGKVYRVIK